MNYIFTCEHGGNKVPAEFKKLFAPHVNLLNTHRGFDIGILKVFKFFTSHFKSPTYYAETTRLLIEPNRSPHHKDLFSFITKLLNKETKERILNNYYLPYRNEVSDKIESLIAQNKKVVHISFHSFTPYLNDAERNTDIGLLYDPKSKLEKEFCKKWKKEILLLQPNLKVRFNYPYLGIADGFTSYLRKQFSSSNYSGIELEVNQKLLQSKSNVTSIQNLLLNSFRKISIN